jgi:hypothetical protein
VTTNIFHFFFEDDIVPSLLTVFGEKTHSEKFWVKGWFMSLVSNFFPKYKPFGTYILCKYCEEGLFNSQFGEICIDDFITPEKLESENFQSYRKKLQYVTSYLLT